MGRLVDATWQTLNRSMTDKWKMDTLHTALLEAIVEAYTMGKIAEDQIEGALEAAIKSAMPELVDAVGKDLSAREGEMLKERRAQQRGFVSRNMRRWRRGFDKLERLIVMSEELGEAMSHALGPEAVANNDPIFEAVISLHARAVLISREILCLMTNGFPDGALARWRTLHEVAIISEFISQNGPTIAGRYLAHRHWLAHERARSYEKHRVRANLGPIEPDVLQALQNRAEAVLRQYGSTMKSDYGWAAPAINSQRPKLTDLEVAVGLDHWRPRYRWATTQTHGSYLEPLEGLGTAEAKEAIRLVGRSNSGMTDPGHMAAITLNLATLPVLMLGPNLDRLTLFRLMMSLSDEIGEAFWSVQNRKAKKRESAPADPQS